MNLFLFAFFLDFLFFYLFIIIIQNISLLVTFKVLTDSPKQLHLIVVMTLRSFSSWCIESILIQSFEENGILIVEKTNFES